MTKKPKNPLRRLSLMLTLSAVLGTMGTAVGASALMSWREPIPELPAVALPAAPEGEEAAWEKIQAVIDEIPATYTQVLQDRRPAVTALAATNLFASLALFIGAIGARSRRRWGLRGLRSGLVLSQGYAILALGVQSWVQLGLLAGNRTLFAPLAAEGGSVAAMALTMMTAQVGTVAVTALLALAQLAFYLWAAALLRRPGAAELLAPPAE